MIIKYQIFSGHNLLVLKYIGDFSIEYFKVFAQIIMSNPECNNVTKVLADYREAIIDFNNSHIDDVVKIRKEILKNPAHVVFIVDKPVPTIPIHLFISKLPGLNNQYCSTILHAIELLELNVSEKEMENILANLSKSADYIEDTSKQK